MINVWHPDIAARTPHYGYKVRKYYLLSLAGIAPSWDLSSKRYFNCLPIKTGRIGWETTWRGVCSRPVSSLHRLPECQTADPLGDRRPGRTTRTDYFEVSRPVDLYIFDLFAGGPGFFKIRIDMR